MAMQPKSWAAEVIADASGTWCGNALRFATKDEAESYVADLYSRWLMVQRTRVVESEDEVNYRWSNDTGLQAVGREPVA